MTPCNAARSPLRSCSAYRPSSPDADTVHWPARLGCIAATRALWDTSLPHLRPPDPSTHLTPPTIMANPREIRPFARSPIYRRGVGRVAIRVCECGDGSVVTGCLGARPGSCRVSCRSRGGRTSRSWMVRRNPIGPRCWQRVRWCGPEDVWPPGRFVRRAFPWQ